MPTIELRGALRVPACRSSGRRQRRRYVLLPGSRYGANSISSNSKAVDQVPRRAGIAQPAGVEHARPFHLPDGGRAVVILPQEVALSVAVEVAGADQVPRRPGIAQPGGAK